MNEIGKDKTRAITILVVSQIAAMSLWFTSAAVLPDMLREMALSPARQAILSSAVQAGFVIGALVIAATALADRFDPRAVFATSALIAASANAGLLAAPLGSDLAVALRIVTGCALAGVYPVGMKIAVGWGDRDRGLLVGLLVGALTLGSASPHLVSYLGGADWRSVILVTSLLAAIGGLSVLLAGLGPHHGGARAFSPAAVIIAWRDRRIRLAILGYLGHMWELYAMWAWIGVAAATAYALRVDAETAQGLAKITAFAAIGIGAFGCVAAGLMADRIGKAEVTILSMALSGVFAVLTAFSLGGPIALTVSLALFWGLTVIADSAQFSAVIADYAPKEYAGGILTFQTALGFGLTTITVQLAPIVASQWGWKAVFLGLALGPTVGILAMVRLLDVPKSPNADADG